MLFSENEFLESTGMSKDELYAKIAKLQLLGVDFKMGDIDKVLYKGQYYNRKTDEEVTGCFRLMHSVFNNIRLSFISDESFDLSSIITISSALVYLLKDDYIVQLKFFMEFIKEDYIPDFTPLDVLFNISGMDKKDFNTKFAKAKLLGVSLDDKFTVKYNETCSLSCGKVNDITYMLAFHDFLAMIPYNILLVIGFVNDLMTKYLIALYEYHQLKKGLLNDDREI